MTVRAMSESFGGQTPTTVAALTRPLPLSPLPLLPGSPAHPAQRGVRPARRRGRGVRHPHPGPL